MPFKNGLPIFRFEYDSDLVSNLKKKWLLWLFSIPFQILRTLYHT